MHIVLSGLTGFVGSHVARWLSMDDFKITGLKQSSSSLKALGPLADALTYYDVDDPETRRGQISQAFMAPVDAVVHVATDLGRRMNAEGRLDALADDSDVLEANLLFPMQLLEATIHREVPIFLNTDTCVPRDYPAMRPYAFSKSYFYEWGSKRCEGTRTRFVNLRLCQPYGPRERPYMFVPWLIRKCLAGGEIKLTAGLQQRDFIYATDVAEAYRLILVAGQAVPNGTTLDCGSGRKVSIRAFAELVHRVTGSKASLQFGALPTRPNEFSWEADTSGLRRLGWQPLVPLELGLQETLQQDFGVHP